MVDGIESDDDEGIVFVSTMNMNNQQSPSVTGASVTGARRTSNNHRVRATSQSVHVGKNEVIEVDSDNDVEILDAVAVAPEVTVSGWTSAMQNVAQKKSGGSAVTSCTRIDTREEVEFIASKPAVAACAKPYISLVDSDDSDEEQCGSTAGAGAGQQMQTQTLISEEEDERKPSARTSQNACACDDADATTEATRLQRQFDDNPHAKPNENNCAHGRRRKRKRNKHHDTSSDFAVALALQALEQQEKEVVNESSDADRDRDRDRALAHTLQQQENEHLLKVNRTKLESESDGTLAQLLQQQEDEQCRKADPTKEENDMTQSSPGKAVVAVQRIIKLVQDVQQNHFPMMANYIDAVAIDDMVYLAEKMLKQQQEFIDESPSVPSYIDIGYHYTNPQNMQAIRTNGLLTKGERTNQHIQSASFHGSVFGDGVYTANNPTSFQDYGGVGLLVGRLQGSTVRVPRSLTSTTRGSIVANTVIGDKMNTGQKLNGEGWPETDLYHEIVLRSSSQCLPMVKYDTVMVRQPQGERCIQYFRTSLQGILDELFNKGSHRTTMGGPSVTVGARTVGLAPPNPFPLPPMPVSIYMGASMTGSARKNSATRSATSKRHSSSNNCLEYKAPQSLTAGIPSNALISPPPPSCNWNDDCVICQDTLSSSPCAVLTVCNHVFHYSCVERAFKSKPQCPVCRKAVGVPQGKSPSGTMSISAASSIRCSGYQENSIIITYAIKGGAQKSYHDNPGQRQSGKRATAYLPNNADGQNLLKRLKYAFLHGLTFTVGTSATTGIVNQCTWSSIHHKTSHTGGVVSHGFPDPSYFINCNEELDGVDVPSAHSLCDDGSEI